MGCYLPCSGFNQHTVCNGYDRINDIEKDYTGGFFRYNQRAAFNNYDRGNDFKKERAHSFFHTQQTVQPYHERITINFVAVTNTTCITVLVH
jgi:hypothetical protein